MLEALVAAALLFCPWVPVPLPPTVLLPSPAYELVEAAHGLAGTRGITTWEEWAEAGPLGEPGTPIVGSARVYLREGATPEVLCHEYKHVVVGHWHPLTSAK